MRSLSDLLTQHSVVKIKLRCAPLLRARPSSHFYDSCGSHHSLDADDLAATLSGADNAELIDIHESRRYLLFGGSEFVKTLPEANS